MESYDIKAIETLRLAKQSINKILKDMFNDSAWPELKDVLGKIRSDLDDVERRSIAGRIRVGILGGRGSGKSTLANAIIGERILPESALIFCTSIPTSILFGETYGIRITSKNKAYAAEKSDIGIAEMRALLESVSKESKNRNNHKEITSISVFIPDDDLQSIEFVDVPGFTRGNKLHQAHAEKYASYLCDLCLVLINNPDSVQIGDREGLEALSKCFAKRTSSTVFIVNRCDESTQEEAASIKEIFWEYLTEDGCELLPEILSLSAKNALAGEGEQFDFLKLTRKLFGFGTRKYVFLVAAALERQKANLRSLEDLCSLTKDQLGELKMRLRGIEAETDKQATIVKEGGWAKDGFDDIEYPAIDIASVSVPASIPGEAPLAYRSRVVDALAKKSEEVNDILAEYQVRLFERFDSAFRSKAQVLNDRFNAQVRDAEETFGVRAAIPTPEFNYDQHFSAFRPETIESLKPPRIRRYVEKIAGGVEFLVRDIEFLTAPISVSIGPVSIPLGIPAGLRSIPKSREEIKSKYGRDALAIMNRYLLGTLEAEGRALREAYVASFDKFLGSWRVCISDYISRIEAAEQMTTKQALSSISRVIEELEASAQEIKNGMGRRTGFHRIPRL